MFGAFQNRTCTLYKNIYITAYKHYKGIWSEETCLIKRLLQYWGYVQLHAITRTYVCVCVRNKHVY